MKRKILISLFVLIGCGYGINATTTADTNTLFSETAYAAILTCSPGEEMYAAFGHTAIRIKDTANGIDLAYNYGTFDFNTPNFYTKFGKGTLLYRLDEVPYYAFERDYESENRSVREQKLDLTEQQLVLMYNLLQDNLKPDNMYYQYDIFYDNCSTRVRDLIEKVLGGEVEYEKTQNSTSFRGLLKPFLENKQWTRLGTDILLGLPVDKITNKRESCFLPQGLYDAMAEIKNPVTGKNLVKSDEEILPRNNLAEASTSFITPMLFFWILLLITIAGTIYGLMKNKNFYVLDNILFSIVGLTGVLLLFLMLWSEHASFMRNLNIFWAMPFVFPFYWMSGKQKLPKLQRRYNFIISCWLGAFIILFYFLPQEFNSSLLPLSLILFIRAARRIW